MRPVENIYFILIAIVLLMITIVVWFIFRKRKKWAISLTSLFIIGYVAFYLYYPTLKINIHAERYEQVTAYLANNYPDQAFYIEPEHYEEGYNIGEFRVNDVKSPTIGVNLRVGRDGQVMQLSTWSKDEIPTQEDLWKVIPSFLGGSYTLDKKIPNINKIDEWIDGELTVFALTMDDLPAIAIFNYSSGGYSFLDLQQGKEAGFISIEIDGYVFTYIDERYVEEQVTLKLKNGEKYMLDVDGNKGRLIVEPI